MENAVEQLSETVKKAVETFLCPGCVKGSDTSCYKKNPNLGESCANHNAGTYVSSIGRILLGMPTGFNRLGQANILDIGIYNKFSEVERKGIYGYSKFNVPVWKHLTKDGHTIVRGFSPRINRPFIDIYTENCLDKINCQEITEKDISEMD
ncbi:MAG: hypothetical protein AABY15_07080 [Nanoarchaeota archaeon]